MTTYAVRICSALVALLGATALLGSGGGCGSSNGSGGNGTTSGSGGGGGAAPDCGTMCDEAMKNCTGDNAVYASKDICLSACKDFPLGKLSDTDGDTVGCREYHAGKPAEMDPKTHCQHAGPGGAGICGANCDGFCSLAVAACGKMEPEFKDTATCMKTCKQFPDMTGTTPFSVNDTTGNNISCRLYHVSVATTDPKTHCPHITLASAPGTCQDATP
jgi:hypothetical protein